MRKKNGGFTLMELLIVMAIIMILAGAIVVRVSTGGDKARIAKATAELEEIATACRGFYADTGLWPTTVDALINAPREGYYENGAGGGATNMPAGVWKGPYLEALAVPKDPWNVEYVLNKTATALYVRSAGSGRHIEVIVHRFET